MRNEIEKGLLKTLLGLCEKVIEEAHLAGQKYSLNRLYGKIGSIDENFSAKMTGDSVPPTRKRRKPPTKQEAARRMKQGKYMGMMRRMPAKVRSHAKSLQKKFGLDRAIKFMSSQPAKNKKS